MAKLQKCEPDDPNRCQASSPISGQCPFLAVPTTRFCPRHGGKKTLKNREKQACHQYRLQVWQERLSEFAEDTNVKSLRGEIGILRIVLENLMLACTTPEQLVMYSSKISDITTKIEKVVTSCERLECRMGTLLDKAAALNLASKIVDIITSHVDDADTVDQISNDIITALGTLTT